MNILKAGRPSEKQKLIDSMKDKEEPIKLQFFVSREFHRKAKKFAIDNEMTLKELMSKALNDFMSK